MASRVKTMMLFSNGNIAAFDEDDNQITELQRKSAIELWAEFATQLGYDVEGCECRTQLPNGIGPQVILQRPAIATQFHQPLQPYITSGVTKGRLEAVQVPMKLGNQFHRRRENIENLGVRRPT